MGFLGQKIAGGEALVTKMAVKIGRLRVYPRSEMITRARRDEADSNQRCRRDLP